MPDCRRRPVRPLIARGGERGAQGGHRAEHEGHGSSRGDARHRRDLDARDAGEPRDRRRGEHRPGGVGTWRRTATGGATSAASTSRAPRPWTVTAMAAASRTSRASRRREGRSPRADAPSGSKAVAVSGRRSATSVRAPHDHQHRGGHEVAAGHPERIAEQQLLQALRRVGNEGKQRPEADEPGDRDGGPGVGGDIRVARGKCDQRRRDDRPAQGAEQQRRSSQPGQHQAGQQAVRERLRGVGQALAYDPEAESAAEPSGEHELEHGAQLDPAHDEAPP